MFPKTATFDSSTSSEGAIEILLEQGGLSLPMVGVAKGLLAAECASNLLIRTLSGSKASASLADESPTWRSSRCMTTGKAREEFWNDLPPDLWLKIFHSAGFLGFSASKFRFMLSTQCKTWKRMLSSPAIWKELELITSDYKDAAHFVHALLMCCQPCHNVMKIRIAQSPLIPDRPWERAHRILYDQPSHNQLFDPLKSDPGLANLEQYIRDAYERAIARGSPLPSREDPVWAPVYRQLIHVMQGRMYRSSPPPADTMLVSLWKSFQRGVQELNPKQLMAIYSVALGLLCLLPAVRTVMLWTILMWILTIGMHLFMDMAASIRANQALPKLL